MPTFTALEPVPPSTTRHLAFADKGIGSDGGRVGEGAGLPGLGKPNAVL